MPYYGFGAFAQKKTLSLQKVSKTYGEATHVGEIEPLIIIIRTFVFAEQSQSSFSVEERESSISPELFTEAIFFQRRQIFGLRKRSSP